MWISPDGAKLIFATFNDTLVNELTWKIYGNPIDGISNPYPKEGRLRYPKVSITVKQGKNNFQRNIIPKFRQVQIIQHLRYGW